MIDALYKFAHPGPDLTDLQQRIPAKYHNYFCLDVQNGSSASGTTPHTHIADCNGTDEQRWSFDPSQDVLYSGANDTTALRAAQTSQGLLWLDWKDETPGSLWGYFLDPYWKVDTVNPCAQQQAPLSSGSDPCVDSICASDSCCCMWGWDYQCTTEVSSVCGQVCPPS